MRAAATDSPTDKNTSSIGIVRTAAVTSSLMLNKWEMGARCTSNRVRTRHAINEQKRKRNIRFVV